MHAAQLKSKAHPKAGKLKHVRVEMSDNGGATVHTAHHGKTVHDYEPEKQHGSYTTKEEAMQEACKVAGVDSAMNDGDADDGASDEAGGATMPKK